MIVTTTDTIQGWSSENYSGIVTAEVVYGTNAIRDFFAGIRDMIGGRTGAYECLFGKSTTKSDRRIKKNGRNL